MKLEVQLVNGVPVLKSSMPSDDEVKSYITQAATARGIDPKVALTVWSREGRGAWQSNFSKNGMREPSHGPFQLLSGGPGTGYPTGLGNKFRESTGLDPSDPKHWRRTVDFALDEAKKGGWGPWYGAKHAGITGFEGIGGTPAMYSAASGAPAGKTPGLQSYFPATVPDQSFVSNEPSSFAVPRMAFGSSEPPQIQKMPSSGVRDLTGGAIGGLDQITASLFPGEA